MFIILVMFTMDTVFDTNIEQVAKDSGIYNETKSYAPANVFVDPTTELSPPLDFAENYTSEFIKGFLKGLIGMGEGEKKNVTIPPEDAYGTWNESMAEEFMMGSLPIPNGYPADARDVFTYDVKRAKELMAQTPYAKGVDVDVFANETYGPSWVEQMEFIAANTDIQALRNSLASRSSC
jgi:FKBP-type peptidyl-prolyl cis-trans isomerase 2